MSFVRAKICAGIILAALCAGIHAAGAAACNLQQFISYDMEIDRTGEVIVPVRKDLRFMIDTGSPISVLTAQTANRMGLQRSPFPRGVLTYYGNRNVVETAKVSWSGHGVPIEMAVFPGDLNGLDGALGMDVMSNFDIEFDFFKGKVNFFGPNTCDRGDAVYWTRDFVRLPIHADRSQHIVFPAEIDGKKIQVMLDTGATETVWSLETARALLGDSEANKIQPSAYVNAKDDYNYPFQTLSFDGVTISHPDIQLVPNAKSGLKSATADQMIIGRSILRQLHLYIAWKDQSLYLSSATAH